MVLEAAGGRAGIFHHIPYHHRGGRHLHAACPTHRPPVFNLDGGMDFPDVQQSKMTNIANVTALKPAVFGIRAVFLDFATKK